MTLTNYALNFLKELIIGDKKITSNINRRKIVELFNSARGRDLYRVDLPHGLSRNTYVLSTNKQFF